MRTCVACGNKTDKRELMRIVAPPQGSVEVDPTGKQAGRGAYVCRDVGCVQGPLKRGRLEYALKTEIGDEDWERLRSSLPLVAGTI
jgi:predicted RNA-binding protein YlxR (DUF448 family)